MSMLNLGEPSRYWPWLKAIVRHLTIPGTKIGFEAIADLQDDLADDQFQDQVKEMLEVMYNRTAEITQRLREQDKLAVKDDSLRKAAEEFAKWLYFKRLAKKFHFADFKGIQESKFVALPLDDIFVDLRVVPEEREDGREDKARELRAKLELADDSSRPQIMAALEELDTQKWNAADGGEGLTPSAMLNDSGPVVLLGGPGSGKTTLIKQLARSCALGEATLRDRFPNLTWAFPVVVPITQYVDEGKSRPILTYVEDLLQERGGDPLLAQYREHFLNGSVLILLDGLDEIADAGQRIAAARAVDEAAGNLGKNRLLTTSRRVGYSISRLSVPAKHFTLLQFSPSDIATFVRYWYIAFEKSQKGDKADLVGAKRTAKELNDEINSNPSVASLATNPLMLTIIALIKHRSVDLPHRRVELYRIALETLLESWNLARSLAQTQHQRPMGEVSRIEQTREVWSHVALWMHSTSNREVSRAKLQEKLVQVLTDECDKTEYEAHAIATSYLDAAAETSGLLEARGPNTFAFVHQSFQEYLAGFRLVRPASKAAERICEHTQDPRWHEVIRLGMGHLSIAVGEKEIVTDIIERLLHSPDPLEPYLCNSLQVALGCLADQIGLRQQQVDDILIEVADRLQTSSYGECRYKLATALAPIERPPGAAAQSRLLQLIDSPEWQVRMEAIRIAGLSPCLEPSALDRFQTVVTGDKDLDVRSHAAWALWRHDRRSKEFAWEIARGLTRIYTHMREASTEEFMPVVEELLEASEPEVQYQVATLLGRWGKEEKALPLLLMLLEATEARYMYQAAELLGRWGKEEKALPVLLKLLREPGDYAIQYEAADTLGQWGQLDQAVPVLLRLLETSEPYIRSQAAMVLDRWGQREKVLPVLLKLLEATETDALLTAAGLLGQWGQQDKAMPVLVKQLEAPEPGTRYHAAALLGGLGQQEKATPVLLKLLDDSQGYLPIAAADLLSEWGRTKEILPVLLKLLEHPEPALNMHVESLLTRIGPQPTAIPALLKLLDNQDGEIRSNAKRVLVQWGLSEDANRTTSILEAVLGPLTCPDKALLAVFQQRNRGDGQMQDLMMRKRLANLIEPLPTDSLYTKSLRAVLFSIIWNNFATSV